MILKQLMAALGAAAATSVTVLGANPIPMDPSVRTGVLPNGLTYYIRQNNTPANQADFFIAQKVGSINEEENQRGLAHFLEHMCFNGTEHFPGNTLIEYLEGIGVKFGANLNAYTSTDETVYNISQVPTHRDSALDSCIMILSDWSGRLLLKDEDIDAERGVIRGEARQRSSAASRILTTIAPEIYEGSVYGNRMPIGLPEVIDNFKPQTLRDYYNKWYHPANQAVIVVGNIDPDKIEASIRRHFADITSGKKSVVATPVEVADNKRPIIAIATDDEQPSDMVQVYYKEPQLPAESAGTIEEVRRDYIKGLVSDMLVERFDILEQQPDCPWSNMGIGIKKFLLSGTRDALMLRATAYDDLKTRKTLDIINTELLRCALHGFTDTELQRARLTQRARLDAEYASSDRESNTDLARKYVGNYLRGTLIPSAEQYYKIMKGVEKTVTLDDVNAYISQMVTTDGSNRETAVYASPKDYPNLTNAILTADAANIDTSAITPYIDTFAGRSLMAELPEAGKITAEEEAPFNSKLLTLSNGIKVRLRHDTSNPDQVLIHAVSPGGFSMSYNPELKGVYKVMDDALSVSGYGGHSSTDLRRLLAGHNVKSAVKIGNMDEELIAYTTPEDLETALQLLWLKATSIQRDDNAFKSVINSERSKLENPNRSATFAMGDSIHAIVYNRHPLGEKLTVSDIDKIDYDDVIALHRERFGDMSDFTYIITGNFDNDSIRPLIERYIASLPGEGRKERAKDIGYGFYQGDDTYRYYYPMPSNPQSITYNFYNGECPFDLQHILQARTLGSILKTRLLAEVREKRGLTYGITSHCSVTTGFNGPDTPSRFILPIYIKVEPGHEEEVSGVVKSTIEDLIQNGPTAEEVSKVKAFLAKEIAGNRDENGYWETVLKVYDQYGKDMDTDYETILDNLNPDTVREFAATYLRNASHVQMTMLPKE